MAEGRTRTISFRALKRERAAVGPPKPEARHRRPKTREDCEDGKRPCPFIGCRYHLALDVKRTALRFAFGEDFVGEMRETCALDVADEGEHGGTEVAALMGLSRQRVSQIEVDALAKLEGYFREQAPHLLDQLAPLLRSLTAARRKGKEDDP